MAASVTRWLNFSVQYLVIDNEWQQKSGQNRIILLHFLMAWCDKKVFHVQHYIWEFSFLVQARGPNSECQFCILLERRWYYISHLSPQLMGPDWGFCSNLLGNEGWCNIWYFKFGAFICYNLVLWIWRSHQARSFLCFLWVAFMLLLQSHDEYKLAHLKVMVMFYLEHYDFKQCLFYRVRIFVQDE